MLHYKLELYKVHIPHARLQVGYTHGFHKVVIFDLTTHKLIALPIVCMHARVKIIIVFSVPGFRY